MQKVRVFLITLGLCLVGCATLPLQPLLDKNFGGPGKDGLRTISALSDGGFIIAGWQNQTKPGHVGTGYLLKLAANGAVAWEKDISTNGENRISNVIERDDRTLVIVVEEYPIDTDPGQAVMMVLSPNGDILRQYPLGGPGPDLVEVLRQTPDGGYLLAGESAESVDGDYQGWLGKLSPEFKFEWEHRIGEPNSSDVFQDVALLQDGTVIGVGMLEEHSTDKDDPAYPWAVKISSDGDVIWSKVIEAENLFALRGIVATPSGQLALSGYTRDWDKNEYDSWVGVMSSDGDIIWDKTIPHPEYDQLTALKATKDGHYVAIGTAKISDGNFGPLLVKFSEGGKEVSSYIHQKPGSQFGRAVVPLNNTMVAVGGFNVLGEDVGQQLWFLTTNLNGNKNDNAQTY